MEMKLLCTSKLPSGDTQAFSDHASVQPTFVLDTGLYRIPA